MSDPGTSANRVLIDRDQVVRCLHSVLESDNSLSRCCAIRALGRLDAADSESRRRLIGLLLDADPDVRVDAARALGRLGASDAALPLLANVEGDPDGEVRIQAVKALAGIRSTGAVERLLRCLQREGYPELGNAYDDLDFNACWEVQDQALQALGKTGDKRAVEPLIDFLRDEDGAHEDLHDSCYRVLAELDDARARAFLLRELKAGTRLARRRTASALAALAGVGGAAAPEIVNALTEALTDPDPSVRINAARALGRCGSSQVSVPLMLLLNDPDAEVRSEVATILGRLRGAEIVGRLLPLLDEPGNERERVLRRQVARVLGEIADAAALDRLSDLLATTDPDLLYEVVRALGRIGQPGPEGGLSEIVANRAVLPDIRVHAAQALACIAAAAKRTGEDRDPDIEAALLEAVSDADEGVAYAALSALVTVQGDGALETLVRLLQGEEPPARSATESTVPATTGPERDREPLPETVQAMVGGHDRTTSTLAAILAAGPPEAGAEASGPAADGRARARPRSPVQCLAARHLGGLVEPGAGAVDALTAAYAEGGPELDREILLALGRLGDRRALPVILRGFESEQREHRLAALSAVAELGSDRGAPAAAGPGIDAERQGLARQYLLKLLDDPDPIVRERAVRSMGALGGLLARERLPRALRDEDLAVCRAALGTVGAIAGGSGESPAGRMHDDAVSSAVADLVFRFSGELRHEAAAALRRLSDFSPAERFLAALGDPQREEFHWMCIDALGELYEGRSTSAG